MDIRQIFLPVSTYPDRVSETTLESTFRLAEILGAKLTVRLSQLNADRATWPAVMGAFPLDFPHMMQELVTISDLHAAASCASLEALAIAYDVKLDLRRTLTTLYEAAAGVVDLARMHDLIVLPVPEINSFDRAWVEPVIFQSGRPVMLMPAEGRRLQCLDRVVVAWDYSREAARALSDALPILHHAREVQVVTVFSEKHIQTTCVAADLDKYLSAHKIRYDLKQLTAGKEKIADILLHHATEVNASLLVMGCYGHGRAQEFLLGGAAEA